MTGLLNTFTPEQRKAELAAERKLIAASLRRRGASAVGLATKGLLNQGEAIRLRRWLNAAAQDVEAGID